MLGTDEILRRLGPASDDDKLIIVPVPELGEIAKRRGTSIDLRLGRWFLSFRQNRVKSADLASHPDSLGAAEVARTREAFVPFGQEFILHPGRFVLGATLEWLHLPRNLSGYVTGKSSLGRHGLVIETAAGIHPGFSGCLTLELANVGEVPLIIRPGMLICQIFLHEANSPAPEDLNNGVPYRDEDDRLSGARKPALIAPKKDAIFENICD